MMRLRNNLRAKRRFRAVLVNVEPVEPLDLFVFTHVVIGKPVHAFSRPNKEFRASAMIQSERKPLWIKLRPA